MLIAIISDTHDNLPNLERFLNWARENQIEAVIHCGDIASAETIDFLSRNFAGRIHLVYGNMDVNYRDEIHKKCDELKNVKLDGEVGEIIVETGHPSDRVIWADASSRRIAFCHLPEKAKELASSGRYNLVFYGHTHQPGIEKIGRCQIINPGTLAGLFQKATFAVFDTTTKKLDLKILELL